jgi:predicted proteasome-type protease
MLRRAKILYAETHLMEFVRAGARMVLETIGTLATLAGILQTWRAGARGKKERKLQALSELSDAVAATMKVVTAKRKRSSSNADLVNAWRQASIAPEGAGETTLAGLCRSKSLYWINPTAWTKDQVRAAGIQLETMETELRRLLAE